MNTRYWLSCFAAIGLSTGASRLSFADDSPTKTVLTFDQALAKALSNPRVAMAKYEQAAAGFRVAEANAAGMPRLTATAFLAPSPKANCENLDCTITSPQNGNLAFSGAFGGGALTITVPLYTFGKVSTARAAAKAGEQAAAALADEAAGDAALEVARAYWGVKLARTLGWMLEDGLEEVDSALKKAEEGSLSVQDKQRLAVLIAEAKAQRADAFAGEQTALAALAALTQTANVDVDEEELAAIGTPQLDGNEAKVSDRPQVKAAKAAIAAAEKLASLESKNYYPDLAVVAQASITRASGVDDPPSIFANDPFNGQGGGVALVARWQFEPWTIAARRDRANALAARAKAQAIAARDGAQFELSSAVVAAKAAQARLAATTDGETAAKAWVASILQAQAVGTAEARDMVDAYIAWFGMKAKWAASATDWNVSVVRIARARGEFRAASVVSSGNQR